MKERNKKLLENLRKLTPTFKMNEEGFEDMSVRDIVDPQDVHGEASDSHPDVDHNDSEGSADDIDDERGEDIDDDGKDDDINALDILKDLFDASDDETKKSIATLVQTIVDNDIDLETIQQFLEEIDVESDKDELDDEDIWGDEEQNPEEDEEEGSEFEPEGEDEEMKEEFRKFTRTSFSPEGSMNEDFGLSDDDVFSAGIPDDLDI